MQSTIINIARKTRQWAMRTRHKYGFPRRLHGMCAIASFQLSKHLEQARIDHKIVFTNTHVWIIVGDHALDVTATQFGKHPCVVFKPIQEYWDSIAKPAKIDKKTAQQFSCRADMHSYMKARRWKVEQMPTLS